MKKLLSLLISVILISTVIAVVPTVSADEIVSTPIDEEFGREYWGEIYDASYLSSLSMVKSDNWYYAYAKSIYLDEVIIYVCGYDGDEPEITIPTEFDGKQINCVKEFYLFSTAVKCIKVPKEITSITNLGESRDLSMDEGNYFDSITPVIECVEGALLEEIIVDSKNQKYSSKDGVLFTKNYIRLLYYPGQKEEEKYVVPNTVKYISKGTFADAKNLKFLTISPNVEELGFGCIPEQGLRELHFENTILPNYKYVDIEGEELKRYPQYIPKVPNTIVYCIEGTDLYRYYKQSFEEPEAYCKELKTLPEFTETLKKESDGKWYYYNNEYKVYKSTLVKYKGKWFYVKDGVWDKTVNNVCTYYKGKSFYIQNGKWNKNINGLVKINNGNWFYFQDGKLYDKKEDLVWYKGKWFYILEGQWYKGKDKYIYVDGDKYECSNTLFKKNGKWFAIKNGKWYKGKSIIKYSGKKFLVNKGFVQFGYSGKTKVDGKTYKIKNGKVA